MLVLVKLRAKMTIITATARVLLPFQFGQLLFNNPRFPQNFVLTLTPLRFRICDVEWLRNTRRCILKGMCGTSCGHPYYSSRVLSTILDLVIVAENLIETKIVYSTFVARAGVYAMSK